MFFLKYTTGQGIGQLRHTLHVDDRDEVRVRAGSRVAVEGYDPAGAAGQACRNGEVFGQTKT